MGYTDEQLEPLRERTEDYLASVCNVPTGCLENPSRHFRCLSPDHEDSTPSMSYYRNNRKVYCHGCGASEDVFGVAGWMIGSESFPEQVREVADALGMGVGQPEAAPAIRPAKRVEEKVPREPDKTGPDVSAAVFDAFCRMYEPEGAPGLKYLNGRGLHDEDVVRHGFGWVAHPSDVMAGFKGKPDIPEGYLCQPFPEDPEGPRAGEVHYCTFRPLRDLGPDKKELKPAGLTSVLWREYLLRRPGAVHVCEGIITAASWSKELRNHRNNVLALNGAGNVKRMLAVLEEVPPESRPKVFLCLDNDKDGRKWTAAAEEGLDRLGVEHARDPVMPGGLNDANDWLMTSGS